MESLFNSGKGWTFYAKYVWDLRKALTVEPIAFLNFLSFQVFMVAHHTGLYEVICYQQFGKNVDCKNLKNDKEAEIIIQETMSQWNMYFSLAHILPAMLAHVLMGAWGDKHGRKINILIGILGLIINAYPFLVLFEAPMTPLWVFVITGFISGATGYMGVIMISSFAYLADIVPKKEDLTVRMVIFSVVMSMAGVIGSLLAAMCMEHFNYTYTVLLSLCFLTLSFFYSLMRLKQVPPNIMRKLVAAEEIKCNGISTTVVAVGEPSKHVKYEMTHIKREKSSVKDHLKASVTLMKEVYQTYLKPRVGHHRAYLLLISVMFFVHLLSGMAMPITSLYVFRSPLSWNGKKLAYFKAASSSLQFIGNIIGILVLKKVLKLKETTIMLVALGCHFIQEIITGLAHATWMMYLGAVVGSLNPLFLPTVKSFVAQLVDHDEVGKSFVMFGLAHDVGMALSSVASNAIYKATVRFMPGFIFFLCGGFLVLDFIVVLLIHLDIIRQDRKELDKSSVDSKKNLSDASL